MSLLFPTRQENRAVAALPVRVWFLHGGESQTVSVASRIKSRLALSLITLRECSHSVRLMEAGCCCLQHEKCGSMLLSDPQEIDTGKDFSIPRPQTTNYTEPYDGYYGQD